MIIIKSIFVTLDLKEMQNSCSLCMFCLFGFDACFKRLTSKNVQNCFYAFCSEQTHLTLSLMTDQQVACCSLLASVRSK